MKESKTSTAQLLIHFGSSVRSQETENSDIDIGYVSIVPLSLAERGELQESIAKKYKLLEDKIDLVDLLRSSPLLQYQVAKEGRLLEGDSDEFIKYKIQAWKMYLDTAKLRKLRDIHLKKISHAT